MLFGISISSKKIILRAIILLCTVVAAMALSSIPWKPAEMLGVVLLRGIYILRAISPLLIISDILHLWIKIPPIGLLIACGIWLGIGLYAGTQTKVTQLDITDARITQETSIVFISDLHVQAFHEHRYVQSIVNQIQSLHPDIVLIG